MSAATPHGITPYYFVPSPSSHPAMAALGLFFVIFGAGQWINGVGWGEYSLSPIACLNQINSVYNQITMPRITKNRPSAAIAGCREGLGTK